MAQRNERVVALRLLLTVLSVAFLATAGRAAEAPQVPEEVERHLRELVDRRLHVAIAVGLVSPGGETYLNVGTTALSDGEPVDEDTVFEIGSITKAFTAILLADMERRGLVDFEDPIRRYLPEGAGVPSRGRDIRLLDLATHASGLPRIPTNFDPADPTNPYADYGSENLLEFLASYELPRDVGAEYEYSNFGAGLLGHLLAEKAGTTYEGLLKSVITGPLGMESTVVAFTPETRARLAQGYNVTGPAPNWDLTALAGAGAIRSTARDMLAFLAANLGLRESPLLEVMRSTHEPRRAAGGPHEVAMGWHVQTDEGRRIVWHNGGTGGYRAFTGFVADRQLGVVVLTNMARSLDPIGFHLLDPSLPLPELAEAPKKKPLFSKD